MNIAVVLAGGSGSRFGGGMPKQFLDLDGRTVVEHSIDVFEQSAVIDEIAVVVHPDYCDLMRGIAERRGWTKLKEIIHGGNERYLSSLHAIDTYANRFGVSMENHNIILHDAARPWFSEEIIDRTVSELLDHEAVAVGIPCTDTIWQSSADAVAPCIKSVPPRSLMWRAQTPQAFRLSLIHRAYHIGLQQSDFAATDDCGVVLRYCPEVPILIVEGSENNRKITFADDL